MGATREAPAGAGRFGVSARWDGSCHLQCGRGTAAIPGHPVAGEKPRAGDGRSGRPGAVEIFARLIAVAQACSPAVGPEATVPANPARIRSSTNLWLWLKSRRDGIFVDIRPECLLLFFSRAAVAPLAPFLINTTDIGRCHAVVPAARLKNKNMRGGRLFYKYAAPMGLPKAHSDRTLAGQIAQALAASWQSARAFIPP